MKRKIFVQHYVSPCGELLLGSLGEQLCLCNWLVEKHPGRVDRRLRERLEAEFVDGATDTTREAARQLDAYFAGELTAFSLPLLCAGSDFQMRVWDLLRDIPYGAARWPVGSVVLWPSAPWPTPMGPMRFRCSSLATAWWGLTAR